MHINSLFINGYKNIKNQTISFPENLSYITLIGLNGSGKSNYMEAISLIFSAYYRGNKEDIDFEYKLCYTLSDRSEYVLSNNSDLKNGNAIKISEIQLPFNVIACYSGESQRLWNVAYKDIYEEFFNKAVNNEYEEPHMLYVNKYVWTISLIALMCRNSIEIKDFLNTHFNITDLAEVTLEFKLDNDNLGAYKSTALKDFLQRLKTDGQYMSAVASMDIGNNLVCGSLDYCRHIFFYLYLACLPKKNDVNKIEAVIKDIDIRIGDMSYKNISEGEKKLLLIECITRILGGEDSLLILDEPDSHVHIAYKHLICQLCDDFKGQTVMSTHSPSVINEVDFDSLRFVKAGVIGNIESVREIISSMTDGIFDVTDGTMLIANKKLVVTEGPNDIKYIKHAAKELAIENERYNKICTDLSFVFQSGANSTEDYFDTIISPLIDNLDKVLFIFDLDADNNKNGQKGYEQVQKKKEEYKDKVEAMFYSKTYPVTDPQNAEPCYIEEFFPLTPELSKYMQSIQRPMGFSEIKKANAFSAEMKTYIKKNYKKYKKAELTSFKIILDEILRLFNL